MRKSVLSGCVAMGALASSGGQAFAFTTTGGYTASVWASTFTSAGNAGPIGITFDTSHNGYVADHATGFIYKFPLGGGTVSSATRLNSTAISGRPAGLAFANGHLYLARQAAGDILEISLTNGSIVRTVASVACATGVAADPLSGDLFVSQVSCTSTLQRVRSPQGTATVVPYAANLPNADGVSFDKEGTIYVAVERKQSDGSFRGEVDRVDGTNVLTPTATVEALVPAADGTAIGFTGTDPTKPASLFVNRNDGKITKVDLTNGTQSDILTGGSRGDLVAVGPDGCLYATQTDSVLRVSSTTGCFLPPPPPGLTGRAFALDVQFPVLGVVHLADTGEVFTQNPSNTTKTFAHIGGKVNADGLQASVITSILPSTSTADAHSVDTDISLLPLKAIVTRDIDATSTTTCGSSTGHVKIGYLAVGKMVLVSTTTFPAPNTKLSASGLTIFLNEQIVTTNPSTGTRVLTVNAIRITDGATFSLIVSSARSDIHGC